MNGFASNTIAPWCTRKATGRQRTLSHKKGIFHEEPISGCLKERFREQNMDKPKNPQQFFYDQIFLECGVKPF
ncbi:unnamed protein product [Ixodes persulcatus]